MRVAVPLVSLLVATSAALANADDAASVTRALASETSAPPSAASNISDAEAIETLRKYYGSDVDKLSEAQLQQLIAKLHTEAKDQSTLEALLEDSKDWFAKMGNSIKAIFVGKDDNNPDNNGGVFGKMWKSLFGSDAKDETKTDTKETTKSSGSGSMDTDVGGSSSMDTDIEETAKTDSSAKEDTSIDTVAPAPSPTPAKKTPAPTSSSRAKLLTSLPVAGTLAAIFVINFVQ